MRRGAEPSPEETQRRAALSSKSFRNRITGKGDLFVKGPDLPEEVKELPDVGKERTEIAKKKLEREEGLSKKELRKSKKAREKAERKASRGSGRFSKRTNSKLAGSVSDISDGKEEEEDEGETMVTQLEPEPEPIAEMDILRTARISKTAVAMDLIYKYPEVKLTPYGSGWAMDSFALIHNAIKAEIRDLFEIGNVMQRRKLLLTMEHIEVFYEWWADFKEFTLEALSIEEDVFYTWVASKDYLRGAFKKTERMRVNGATRNLVTNISDYRDKFLPYLPVGERLDGLLVQFNEFKTLLEHYDAIAASLPAYIETLFKQKERDATVKELVAEFRRRDGYNRNLVLLVRWMPDRNMRRWALSHLKPKDLIHFKGWRRVIQEEHCRLALSFENIVMGPAEEDMGAPVIGAAMAINEEMREHINKNRVSVRSLPNAGVSS
ncbi:unnamed protein product [Chondrus crispus]|uniref:Uncharacterized protein n=1 Tax=Chondrus crispus TaxID=2769 RepID=R7QDF4_CHOCR|nr:unnamed protein product [Chondrus crispus]CDF36104.1 unnamed protein product [Chondrus crispus]|eukprot:XP_005715923.1 unnamed protein product [Chondrus crispus]